MTQTEAAVALRAMIDASGLSVNQWAVQVAQVQPRTVRRWLTGEWTIPVRIMEQLQGTSAVTQV